jgi:2-polyprenyl-3-methyl-5-hydroxy-6-metoxy-1,4-benzoquinol methylase
MELKTEPSCTVCLANKPETVVPGVAQSRFDIVQCRSCGLEFMYPQPSWEEIQAIYTSDYYATWDMKSGEAMSTARMKRLTFKRRLGELGAHVQSGRILDIGTATGFFLDEVKSEGRLEPFGVELSEYAGNIARQKFGQANIHIGTLETAPFEPGFFNAVAMSDLIEHVQDPRATLKLVHRLLAPNGVAMIMTPDVASPSRRWMGPRWTHFKLEHLFLFSPPAMRQLAAETGFEVISLGRARKTMTLKYLRDQLQTYRHPLLTPLSVAVTALLAPWRDTPFPITMGEMLVFLRKKA